MKRLRKDTLNTSSSTTFDNTSPPDIRDQLFSPFCTTKARGFGLGLPLVQRILDEMGGQLDLQSDAGGTQVILLLPPGRPTGPTTAEERASEQPPT